ncbi:MAG: PilZ domain-containing protein [Thermochromatium sp.]
MITPEERRGFRRLDTPTDVVITRLATGESMLVRLINLSASGGAFRSDRPIVPDEELEVLIRSPNDKIEPLIRRARVVRLSQDQEGPVVAVEFVLDRD